jgi:predicted dehydrogenase
MNKKNRQDKIITRRNFLKKSALSASVAFGMPYIIPSISQGNYNSSDKINFGCIGVGRMGRGDMRDILHFEDAQIIAVCDVDSWRLKNAQAQVENHYSNQQKSGRYKGCTTYLDYRELLQREDIDAVLIATPDHWHTLPAIQAAKAGKDIFLQKPLTLTIPEGRILSDTVHRYMRILQVGSQQRSDFKFRFAAELVRNEYIGQLHTVKVGFGKDPFTGVHPVTPVPEELAYDTWLGPAPFEPYIEQRVHPQKSYNRPGWLRTSDYCCGMITGWGSHHIDSAHWGMDTEYTGPVEIDAWAEYSKGGVWDVHGAFRIEYTYANGVKLICADNAQNKQGVVFEGTEGWIHVKRGFIDAFPKSLLEVVISPNEIQFHKSNNHKRNFMECIRSREKPVAPVEIGHRSASACILGYIAMKLQRNLKWDHEKEQFINDPAANRMLTRSYRSPWYV